RDRHAGRRSAIAVENKNHQVHSSEALIAIAGLFQPSIFYYSRDGRLCDTGEGMGEAKLIWEYDNRLRQYRCSSTFTAMVRPLSRSSHCCKKA
ncbi:hypothetical protein HAX54_044110, partial [Datura stramonium]|nr:hypothetical protein [Datura stramonium]